jgi:single-strand DNA-binding protein
MTEANVSFAGNLTDDPELRHTEGGIARAMFRVAVSARKDQEASFFTVIVWRDQAEHAAQSLSKGSRVVVVGRLQQRTWTAEDGSARSVVEVVAEELGPSLRWRRRRPGRRGARTTSQDDKRCDERTRKHASVPLRRGGVRLCDPQRLPGGFGNTVSLAQGPTRPSSWRPRQPRPPGRDP